MNSMVSTSESPLSGVDRGVIRVWHVELGVCLRKYGGTKEGMAMSAEVG